MLLITATVKPEPSRSNKQTGAALLVFLLLVVVSASTMLLSRLNSAISQSVYNPATSLKLDEAKTALLAWAINHPFNPGTLPMPDRNSDSDYDGDSDCYNGGPIGNNLLLGRLPWRGYPSPCKDAASLSGLGLFPGITTDIGSDRTGQVLWYAAAHNLVYETPEYPFISPAIAGKPNGWITVRDSSGAVISDQVAFVVIAPGPVLSPQASCGGTVYAGQDRSGSAPAIGNFLDSVTINSVTYSNADYDQDFIMYPNSFVTNEDTTLDQCDQFNDQLVFVTADELLDAVSKRVLNETANALSAYHNVNGALPWLTTFADPKAEPKALRGTATSSSNNLTDTAANFTEWGVTAGDPVWNLTDGSRTTVSSVAANTLTLGTLRFGTNNTFTTGDEYFVDVRYMPDSLMQTATAGSDGNTLVDSGRDFEILGVLPGDVIENLDDGSSGIVATVDGDEITVTGLVGGADNEFASGDDYRIRTNTSEVTNNTANLTLIDTNADFVTMGVQVGDIVHNLWDQATGNVTSIASANQLTVNTLQLGTGVVFNAGEPYRISRYKGRANTRTGLLPIHQPGEVLPSGFTIDWNLTGGTIATTLATDSTYTTALSGYAGSSSGYSGTITVPEATAACQRLASDFVRCKGIYDDSTATFLAGTATTGSTSLALRDSTRNFTTLGTKRGDKVRNLTDGTTGIVFSTSSTQLTLVNINGSTNVGINVGDNYQIELATGSFTFNAAASSTANAWQFRVYYPGTVNESLMAVGDTIENTNGSQSVGRITSINTASNYIVYTPLQGNPSGGSTYADIYDNELVRIKYNFVSRRQYQFDVTMKGTAAESTSGGIRTRAVCTGYNASCTSASNNASIKGDGSTAWVTIRDYEGATQVGQSTNTLSTGGVVFRSLRIAGLQYSMDTDSGDLPDWFVRNKWYQYVMVAYNNGDAPGGTSCVAGTNCLTVNIKANPASTATSDRDNVRAVVMLAGKQLTGQTWTAATTADYFDEPENTDADDLFDRFPGSGSFNDLLRVAISCPTDTTKLCWSN